MAFRARYEGGETVQEIADSTGYGKTTTHAWLTLAGVTFRPTGRRPKNLGRGATSRQGNPGNP